MCARHKSFPLVIPGISPGLRTAARRLDSRRDRRSYTQLTRLTRQADFPTKRACWITNEWAAAAHLLSYSGQNKPCGKPHLNPAHNPMTKLGVTTPVGNWHFHPQWFSRFLSGSEQERHRLIILCTSRISWPVDCYPQKSLALYINIKNKLYKNSLFLFFISLSAFFSEQG